MPFELFKDYDEPLYFSSVTAKVDEPSHIKWSLDRNKDNDFDIDSLHPKSIDVVEKYFDTQTHQLFSFKLDSPPKEALNRIVQSVHNFCSIEKVIFNGPATIVFWSDGIKTVVKCREGETFDKWTGLSMALAKRVYGDKFHRIFREFCKEDSDE